MNPSGAPPKMPSSGSNPFAAASSAPGVGMTAKVPVSGFGTGFGSAPAAPGAGFGKAPVSKGFGSAPAAGGFGSAPAAGGFGGFGKTVPAAFGSSSAAPPAANPFGAKVSPQQPKLGEDADLGDLSLAADQQPPKPAASPLVSSTFGSPSPLGATAKPSTSGFGSKVPPAAPAAGPKKVNTSFASSAPAPSAKPAPSASTTKSVNTEDASAKAASGNASGPSDAAALGGGAGLGRVQRVDMRTARARRAGGLSWTAEAAQQAHRSNVAQLAQLSDLVALTRATTDACDWEAAVSLEQEAVARFAPVAAGIDRSLAELEKHAEELKRDNAVLAPGSGSVAGEDAALLRAWAAKEGPFIDMFVRHRDRYLTLRRNHTTRALAELTRDTLLPAATAPAEDTTYAHNAVEREYLRPDY